MPTTTTQNYLILTLGTRDVQLNKSALEQSNWEIIDNKFIRKDNLLLEVKYSPDFPTNYTLSPRKAGKIVLENIELFMDFLSFPMITPLVAKILDENIPIHKCILVYTDQEQEWQDGKVKDNHYNSDTFYFKEIIYQALQRKGIFTEAQLDEYAIYEQITNIDLHYKKFGKGMEDLIGQTDSDEIDKIYLLPQGGLDQINQAITMQLIQSFGNKVQLYEKPDGGELKKLEFTSLFLYDLHKQKINKHLQDYDFGLIDKSLTTDKYVLALCRYANKRLKMQHNDLRNDLELINEKFPNESYRFEIENNRLKDCYLAAKINYNQGNYEDFLWRMFTIYENIYLQELWTYKKDLSFQHLFRYNDGNNNNTALISYLEKNMPEGIIPYLEKRVRLNNPSRNLYEYLHTFLIKEGHIQSRGNTYSQREILTLLGKLTQLRNECAHNMQPVTQNEIDQKIKNGKQGSWLLKFDTYFEIKNMDVFDTIAQLVKQSL